MPGWANNLIHVLYQYQIMPTDENGTVRCSYFTTKILRLLKIEYTVCASVYATEHFDRVTF